MGAFASTRRTAEQTDLAHFYSENFFTQWNRALRGIALEHVDRTASCCRSMITTITGIESTQGPASPRFEGLRA